MNGRTALALDLWREVRELIDRVVGPRGYLRISAPEPLSRETVAAIVGAARDTRVAAVVSLVLEAGLRCAQVADLDLSDVDLDPRMPHVRVSDGMRREAFRREVIGGPRPPAGWVPLPASTVGYLRCYLSERGDAPGPLFASSLVAARRP